MGRGRRDENASDTSSLSSGSSVSSDSSWERKRRRRRRRDISSESESEYSSSEDESRKRRRKKRKQKHKRERKLEKPDKSEKKRKRDKDKHESRKLRKSRKHHRHHHHHNHHQSGDEQDEGRDSNKADTQQAKLQVTMEAREQEKLLIYQNAKLAKARLNGELREVQAQQAKLQDMYGTIDWRARKKLRIEKKKLERSVAAGKKLAQIEEEESARMDAFRIALGLPTAEAQRQAEWRAEATRALVAQEPPHSGGLSTKPTKKAIIGPQLPR